MFSIKRRSEIDERDRRSPFSFSRKLGFAAAIAVLLCHPAFLAAQPSTLHGERQKVSISDDDFANVAQEIKGLSDPTFRAFLRVHILNWLPQGGDKLRVQNALLVGSDALADIQTHQDEIGATAAYEFREALMKVLNRWSPDDASALAARYTLHADEKSKNDVVRNFSAALSSLNDPGTKDQSLELARKAIVSGEIPPGTLLGELLRLDKNNSPQLSAILSMTLGLEETHQGALPLSTLNFFRFVFLKNNVPVELQVRFLSVVVRDTRLSPAVFERDPTVRGPAIELLTGILPHVEKLAPTLYPEAAGRLQQLTAGVAAIFKSRQAAENRISQSSRPLEQTISEAADTGDKFFRRDLLQRAALLARKQGELHRAVELMVSRQDLDEAEDNCLTYSPTDEFLGEIVTTALKAGDMEISEFAALAMRCPVDRANAFRDIALQYYEKRDIAGGQRALGTATKSLKETEEGTRKALAYLALARVSLRFEPANSEEVFRRAVESINKLPRPEKDEEKKAYRSSLLYLAEDVIRTFRSLARHDPGVARALSVDIRLGELRTSASAGISSGVL